MIDRKVWDDDKCIQCDSDDRLEWDDLNSSATGGELAGFCNNCGAVYDAEVKYTLIRLEVRKS